MTPPTWVKLGSGQLNCDRCKGTAEITGKVGEVEAFSRRHFRCPPRQLPPLPKPSPRPTPQNRAPVDDPTDEDDPHADPDIGNHDDIATRLEDDELEVLRMLVATAETHRQNEQLWPERIADMLHGDLVDMENPLPAWIPASLTRQIPELNFVEGMLAEQRLRPEFARMEDHAVEITWSTGGMSKNGDMVLGRCGAIGPKARKKLKRYVQDPPWWQMELCLCYWLGASQFDRQRLLHHELGHCGVKTNDRTGVSRPTTRNHDSEEHFATLAAFGPRRTDAACVEFMLLHTDSLQKLKQWGVRLPRSPYQWEELSLDELEATIALMTEKVVRLRKKAASGLPFSRPED